MHRVHGQIICGRSHRPDVEDSGHREDRVCESIVQLSSRCEEKVLSLEPNCLYSSYTRWLVGGRLGVRVRSSVLLW